MTIRLNDLEKMIKQSKTIDCKTKKSKGKSFCFFGG